MHEASQIRAAGPKDAGSRKCFATSTCNFGGGAPTAPARVHVASGAAPLRGLHPEPPTRQADGQKVGRQWRAVWKGKKGGENERDEEAPRPEILHSMSLRVSHTSPQRVLQVSPSSPRSRYQRAPDSWHLVRVSRVPVDGFDPLAGEQRCLCVTCAPEPPPLSPYARLASQYARLAVAPVVGRQLRESGRSWGVGDESAMRGGSKRSGRFVMIIAHRLRE